MDEAKDGRKAFSVRNKLVWLTFVPAVAGYSIRDDDNILAASLLIIAAALFLTAAGGSLLESNRRKSPN